jgi:[acyl-carrier-protein] S-malonyltransferase
MQPAADGMANAVAAAAIAAPRTPIVLNDSAASTSEAARIGDELVYQLTHPVRWVACVQYMASQGVDEFIEIGPGRTLTGLIKRIAADARLRNISGAASVRA